MLKIQTIKKNISEKQWVEEQIQIVPTLRIRCSASSQEMQVK